MSDTIEIRWLYTPDRVLLYSIEKLAAGTIYDFAIKCFVAEPKHPTAGMQPLSVSRVAGTPADAWVLYHALLGRSALVDDGEYALTFRDMTAGGVVVGTLVIGIADRCVQPRQIAQGLRRTTRAATLPPPTAVAGLPVGAPRGRGISLDRAKRVLDGGSS